MDKISIRGARTHNLKNIDIDIPRDKLVVITGLSGSGKSSLAFDTLYAEGQRRYVESLSTYARQFLSMMDKPDVDHIEGLSPAISIEQKTTSHNPRSTVGTITEIYDYLRLLFARIGEPRCPTHDLTLAAQTVSQMVDQILEKPEGGKYMLLAPLVKERKGEHVAVFNKLHTEGYIRVRVDGHVYELDEVPALEKNIKHTIEAVIDRFKIKADIASRLADSVETALNLSDGLAVLANMDDAQDETIFSSRYACPECGYSISELEPRLFSFNNPAGACPTCDGLGTLQQFDIKKLILDDSLSLSQGAIGLWNRNSAWYYQMLESVAKHYQFSIDTPFAELPEKIRKVILHGSGRQKINFVYVNDKGNLYEREHVFEGVIPNLERRYKETDSDAVREDLGKYMTTSKCGTCHGARLNEAARHVFIDNDVTIQDIVIKPIEDCLSYFQNLSLDGNKADIGEKVLKEINERLSFLVNVGLDYLSLARQAGTLSGGEAQRIRLASQIGAGLVGVMYVLDEPSIGLHQRDNERLLSTLNHLRDLGNTVLVVEHDEDAVRSADFVIDIGPGAGVHGGEVVASGTLDDILNSPDSITGKYLSGELAIEIPEQRNQPNDKWLVLSGAKGNNLNDVTLKVPYGLFTCITGVSGSGKSTLINQTLYPLAATKLNKATTLVASEYQSIDGLDYFDKVIDIDQSPIGRTPRSNPATYAGIFTPVRELFAGTQEARARGYKPGRFSFNVKGGRCEACQGDGVIKVEMHFLPDVYVDCDVCHGKRYNRETLEVQYKGKNIAQVLDMTIEEALEFFEAVPALKRRLQTLMDVGLSYITLGQSAVTLSGGEAQRVKLSKELSKRGTGQTLYILDEPTTGLHFHDIKLLMQVLTRLRDQGNTIIVIEHNLDVIKCADWLVDLGPEGGIKGGQIIADGTPEQVAASKVSHTGRFLKPLLK